METTIRVVHNMFKIENKIVQKNYAIFCKRINCSVFNPASSSVDCGTANPSQTIAANVALYCWSPISDRIISRFRLICIPPTCNDVNTCAITPLQAGAAAVCKGVVCPHVGSCLCQDGAAIKSLPTRPGVQEVGAAWCMSFAKPWWRQRLQLSLARL